MWSLYIYLVLMLIISGAVLVLVFSNILGSFMQSTHACQMFYLKVAGNCAVICWRILVLQYFPMGLKAMGFAYKFIFYKVRWTFQCEMLWKIVSCCSLQSCQILILLSAQSITSFFFFFFFANQTEFTGCEIYETWQVKMGKTHLQREITKWRTCKSQLHLH